MMDRVLCSRAREVGGCRHVPGGARRTDPQTMESGQSRYISMISGIINYGGSIYDQFTNE